VCIAITVMGMASAVSAQTVPAAPPNQGLFGGVRPETNAKSRLDLTASLVEGYDSDVPTTLQSQVDPSNLQTGGATTTFLGAADYQWRNTWGVLAAKASTNVRHYADLGEVQNLGQSAGIGASFRLSEHSTLLVNQAAAYSPTFLYGIIPTTDSAVQPGDDLGTPSDYSVLDFASYSYTSSLAYTRSLSRRGGLSVSGQFVYTDRVQETAVWRDVTSTDVRAQYSHGMSRNTSLTVGSSFRSGAIGYVDDSQTKELALGIGAEHTRMLSPTRQVRYRFRLGPVAADVPDTSEGVGTIERQYYLETEVGVDYPVVRNWQVRGTFRRRLEYDPDLPEPVFANGGSIGADGLLHRRVDLSVSAAYSSGASLLSKNNLRFDVYTGDVRIRLAFNRTLAAYGEYLYFYYDFRGSSEFVSVLPPGLERNGVRAGLTVWLPALRR
jgi:hypothetical protein